jgi:hypothetical protein
MKTQQTPTGDKLIVLRQLGNHIPVDCLQANLLAVLPAISGKPWALIRQHLWC